MFCPVCRDEYRPGFTRCATCDVTLVERLDAGKADRPAPILAEVAADEPTANFCGFLTFDEARDARQTVKAAGIPAEILIRDAPPASEDATPHDEFWLRVRPRDFRAVVALIGFEPATADDVEDSFKCSACGATVRGSDAACPGCGLRFEE